LDSQHRRGSNSDERPQPKYPQRNSNERGGNIDEPIWEYWGNRAKNHEVEQIVSFLIHLVRPLTNLVWESAPDESLSKEAAQHVAARSPGCGTEADSDQSSLEGEEETGHDREENGPWDGERLEEYVDQAEAKQNCIVVLTRVLVKDHGEHFGFLEVKRNLEKYPLVWFHCWELEVGQVKEEQI